MTITSCSSAEQVSILLSSASVLADNMQMSARKTSLSSGETGATTRKVSVEKKLALKVQFQKFKTKWKQYNKMFVNLILNII